MRVTVPSFAKINLGLRIGALRDDGFHELRTVYQTIALHDIIRVLKFGAMIRAYLAIRRIHLGELLRARLTRLRFAAE